LKDSAAAAFSGFAASREIFPRIIFISSAMADCSPSCAVICACSTAAGFAKPRPDVIRATSIPF
jgi:hypothetical protein